MAANTSASLDTSLASPPIPLLSWLPCPSHHGSSASQAHVLRPTVMATLPCLRTREASRKRIKWMHAWVKIKWLGINSAGLCRPCPSGVGLGEIPLRPATPFYLHPPVGDIHSEKRPERCALSHPTCLFLGFYESSGGYSCTVHQNGPVNAQKQEACMNL